MRIFQFALIFVISACATTVRETLPDVQITSNPITIPMPARDVQTLTTTNAVQFTDPFEIRHLANPTLQPHQTIDEANKAAKIEPGLEYYSNAEQVYPYTRGGLFQLYAAPEKVSLISLQKGESLISLSAGDTARWIVGDTVSGDGTDKQVNIIVKPIASGPATNLVITTSKRTYLLELRSFRQTYMAALRWTYPLEEAKIAAEASKSPIHN